MKLRFCFSLLLAGFIAAGCAHHHAAAPKTQPAATTGATGSEPIVTPDTSLTAKVVRYNSVGRFVVLSFPVGQMPKAGQTLFLYREGMKVGSVQIGPQHQDNDVVADIMSGDAQVGDEVREQ